MNTERLVAENFLKMEVVKLNPNEPFLWSSGWWSPIYCDSRLSLSYVSERRFIQNRMAVMINNNFAKIDAICAVAEGGVPMGALIAHILDLPLFSMHPAWIKLTKNDLEPKRRILVFDDITSTGISSLSVVKALKEAGHTVLGVVSLFTYGFKEAETNFKIWDVSAYALTNLNTLCDVALETGYLKSEELDAIKKLSKDQVNWYKNLNK